MRDDGLDGAGLSVAFCIGRSVVVFVGPGDGLGVGKTIGRIVDFEDGLCDGLTVGGRENGAGEGWGVGDGVGLKVGFTVGFGVGDRVDWSVGMEEGVGHSSPLQPFVPSQARHQMKLEKSSISSPQKVGQKSLQFGETSQNEGLAPSQGREVDTESAISTCSSTQSLQNSASSMVTL